MLLSKNEQFCPLTAGLYSLVLVLCWDELYGLFRLLKTFLALLRWFLMSLPAPPSYLIVLLGSWILSVLEDLLCFLSWGVWDIQHHHLCLLLADLQAYLLCKHAEMGGFLIHVLMSVWDQRRSWAKSRSWRVEERVHLMPHGQSDVVCHITQSIVRLKSNANIGHPCRLACQPFWIPLHCPVQYCCLYRSVSLFDLVSLTVFQGSPALDGLLGICCVGYSSDLLPLGVIVTLARLCMFFSICQCFKLVLQLEGEGTLL